MLNAVKCSESVGEKKSQAPLWKKILQKTFGCPGLPRRIVYHAVERRKKSVLLKSTRTSRCTQKSGSGRTSISSMDALAAIMADSGCQMGSTICKIYETQLAFSMQIIVLFVTSCLRRQAPAGRKSGEDTFQSFSDSSGFKSINALFSSHRNVS